MSAISAESERATGRNEPTAHDALLQLREALQIIDSLKIAEDIGALLQEVINRLEDTLSESL